MVSKNLLKLIKSLHQKKYRNQHGLFFIEGYKSVKEFLDSNFKLEYLLVTNEMKNTIADDRACLISNNDLEKISALRTPSGVLGVFQVPRAQTTKDSNWIVALDAIRDPGNLGTVIRLCDWFGIDHLVCSPTTVDCYNPKVLQATMGSMARVHIVYEDLETFINGSGLPVFGAYMDGDSIYKTEFPEKGILVMGNEANGISASVTEKMDYCVGIPQFGDMTTESLNVATATGILLSEIRRGS